MNFSELKLNMKVQDKWYNHTHRENWGVGKIIKILKTRVHILFPNKGLVVFDKSHVKNFLIKSR